MRVRGAKDLDVKQSHWCWGIFIISFLKSHFLIQRFFCYKNFFVTKICLLQKIFCLFSRYGIEYLNLEELSAKIKFGNLASENLFKSLGFQEVSRSEVFQETTFLLRVSQDTRTLVQAIDCTLQDFINPEE